MGIGHTSNNTDTAPGFFARAKEFLTSDSKATADAFALVLLGFYVGSQLVIKYSILPAVWPIIYEWELGTVCNCITVGLALATIAMRPRNLSIWQIVLSVATLFILLTSAQRVGDYRLLLGYLVLIAIAGVDLKRLCNVYYKVAGIITVAMILAALADLLPNTDVMPNTSVVFCYGSLDPNLLGAILFSIVGAMAVALWDKETWWVSLALTVVAGVFSYTALSSHAATVTTLAMAPFILIGHLPQFKRCEVVPRKVFIVTLVVVPLVLIGVMMLCTVYYDGHNPLFSWFNNLLHGRPFYAHQYFVNAEGFPHLGQPETYYDPHPTDPPFANVDSGYCYTALIYGLFTLYALFATYVTAVVNMARRNERHLFVFVVLIIGAFYLVIEKLPLWLPVSFPALILAAAFVANKPDERSTM